MDVEEKSLEQREEELLEKEKILDERENQLNEREKGLENKPFSRAFQRKKESWYEKVDLTVKQVDIILYTAIGALIVVFILIALEATGIFKL